MVLSPALQALLWAALVFPGAGHLHLQYYRRGVALIAVTLSSLALLLFQFIRQVQGVLEKLLGNDATLDWPRLVGATLQACADDTVLMSALWALLICWLFGMFDAYRLGRGGREIRRKPSAKTSKI